MLLALVPPPSSPACVVVHAHHLPVPPLLKFQARLSSRWQGMMLIYHAGQPAGL